MLKASKRSYVPHNASTYVKKEADVILTHNGGDSAIREMIEELIVSEGLEEEYLALWS
jgi:3-deoxy-D-manno-octulosonate 8-phosphate phosphatase KdsC-like HAD superfamily phosphatase